MILWYNCSSRYILPPFYAEKRSPALPEKNPDRPDSVRRFSVYKKVL